MNQILWYDLIGPESIKILRYIHKFKKITVTIAYFCQVSITMRMLTSSIGLISQICVNYAGILSKIMISITTMNCIFTLLIFSKCLKIHSQIRDQLELVIINSSKFMTMPMLWLSLMKLYRRTLRSLRFLNSKLSTKRLNFNW